MMLHHEQLKVQAYYYNMFIVLIHSAQEVSDVTSDEWISMKEFAGALSAAAACNVKFNESNKVPMPGF